MLKSLIPSLVIAFCALIFSSPAAAAAVDISEPAGYVLDILTPDFNSEWHVGTKDTVRWTVAKPETPPGEQIDKPLVTLDLIAVDSTDFKSITLAENLDLFAGSFELTVPVVDWRLRTYRIHFSGSWDGYSDPFVVRWYDEI